MKTHCILVFLALFYIGQLAKAQKLGWIKQMRGTDLNTNAGCSIALDASGNVYTTGYFRGIVDFDPGPGTHYLTTAGNDDIFISKSDADGNFVWAKNMGGQRTDKGYSIAVDATGQVYTTGFFQETADFDPGPGTFNLLASGTGPLTSDCFILKLDVMGNFVWAKKLGGTRVDGDISNSIAVDESGHVYTTGYFEGTADFDPGPGTFNLSTKGPYDTDSFISKLDAEGNFVWAKQMGGSNYENFKKFITLDKSGHIYTNISFFGTEDFDPGADTFNLTSAGGTDIVILKLDAAGNLGWAKQMGGTNSDYANEIALDGQGNLYATGNFSGTADFDPGPDTFNLSSAGESDIFISKLDASGNFLWAKQMGGTSSDNSNSIVIDALGNMYTTGWFRDTADFNPGSDSFNLTAPVKGDIFFSKLDALGNFVWATNCGATDGAAGLSMALDSLGNLYTTGVFRGTADFDPGADTFNLTSGGRGDIFISKFENPPTSTAWKYYSNIENVTYGQKLLAGSKDKNLVQVTVNDYILSDTFLQRRVLLVKWDTVGNVLWKRYFKKPAGQDSLLYFGQINGLFQKNNGDWVAFLSCFSARSQLGYTSMLSFKDSNGDLIQEKLIQVSTPSGNSTHIEKQANDQFLMTLSSTNSSHVLLISPSGDILNSRLFSGSDLFFKRVVAYKNGWIHGGSVGNDVFLSMIGPDLNSRKSKSFGDLQPQLLRDMQILDDDHILMVHEHIPTSGGAGDRRQLFTCLDSNFTIRWSKFVSPVNGSTDTSGLEGSVKSLFSAVLKGEYYSAGSGQYSITKNGEISHQNGDYLSSNLLDQYKCYPLAVVNEQPFMSVTFNMGTNISDIVRCGRMDSTNQCFGKFPPVHLRPWITSTQNLNLQAEESVLIPVYEPDLLPSIPINICAYPGVCPENNFIDLEDTIRICQNPKTIDIPKLWFDLKVKWFDGDTSFSRSFDHPGKVYYHYETPCFSGTDTIKLISGDQPFDLGSDTLSVCSRDTLVYNSPVNQFQMEWFDDLDQQKQNNTGKPAFVFDTVSNQSYILRKIFLRQTTSSEGCNFTDFKWVKVFPKPIRQLPDTIFICKGDTLLKGIEFYPKASAWNWSGPNGHKDLFTIRANTEGKYALKILQNGCTAFDSTWLKISPVLTGTIFASIDGTEIAGGTTISLETSAILSLSVTSTAQNVTWKIDTVSYSNMSNPFIFHIHTDLTLHTEARYEDRGCPWKAGFSAQFLISDPVPAVFPNLVTQNRDGINDFFVSLPYLPKGDLEIYNRWGMKIFSQENYEGRWPESSTPSGTYFFRFRYKNQIMGWVDVVK